ncbi:4-oxalomesaconate hydratase [Lactobacillus sp. CBA3606]|uniref:amidohydrolase family protein n=1 Tax=Lactobacillus sp. CBA3606 TaxID=2099789 RepID=UPI000CFC5434|nr:amidohydrolase family protein [Lactobacillus sp. CBA3606]AVK63778.1 4-oxalomesaconate hydratase [Lactobacillus sp. CBA3606]
MLKTDVFAHVLTPKFYQAFLAESVDLTAYPFLKNPALTDLAVHQAGVRADVRQVISMANLNPEDFFDPERAAELCQLGNRELSAMVAEYPATYRGAVGMLPMNNIAAAVAMLTAQIQADPHLLGVQLFTTALGKPLTDPAYRPIFEKLAALKLPIWLHPVFDMTKPANNITFSWEYELTQTMYAMVTQGFFQMYPQLKVIVHHAGAMVPYFAGRIDHILPAAQAADFKKFYVDTALLGNSAALQLTVAYYGIEHVMFGTDAPFGSAPNGATDEIVTAIADLHLTAAAQTKLYQTNFETLIN